MPLVGARLSLPQDTDERNERPVSARNAAGHEGSRQV